MIIVYKTKTGFTKRYADILAAKTDLPVYNIKDISKINSKEEIIFLSNMRFEKLQGIRKMEKYNIKAVCVTGYGYAPLPHNDYKVVVTNNNGIPYFYLSGGMKPLRDLKGIDKLYIFIIYIIGKIISKFTDKLSKVMYELENGYNDVREENLEHFFRWYKENA